MKRLAVVTTHPIQYNAPWFKLLNDRSKIEIKVFYTWHQAQNGEKFDPGFGKNVKWDIPLLEGYNHTFVENKSSDPGSHHYNGIVNPTLNTEIEIYGPDAILVFGWSFNSHLKCLKFFKGKIPILFRGDSTLLDEQKGIKKVLRRVFLRHVYKNIDFGLYVGTNNKKYYLKHGLKERQLFSVPHAIDNNRFTGDEAWYKSNAIKWRRKFNIGDNDIAFLFAGKLEKKKNPELLIQAFEETLTNHTHLVIVGNGEEESKLKETYSHVQNLHFLEFQNQSLMPSVYNMCDVFALPSQGPGETWGLALNEAMACKKAVLASDMCGGAVDLVEVGKNGFIFRSGDKEDLIHKMHMMINDKNRLRIMGEASFKIIQKFSFTSICSSIEAILNNNLNTRGHSI
jgi:glycosyltransferase involved in cell wall biosynthesis